MIDESLGKYIKTNLTCKVSCYDLKTDQHFHGIGVKFMQRTFAWHVAIIIHAVIKTVNLQLCANRRAGKTQIAFGVVIWRCYNATTNSLNNIRAQCIEAQGFTMNTGGKANR